MELTPEMAARYAGGQIEVQNQGEGYVYRGEIATATVVGAGDGATFKVTLTWSAKRDGGRWVNDTNLVYEASLLIYSVSDIGGGRTFLQSDIVGEIVTLFPRGGSKLDPSRVEGLSLG